MNIFFDTSVLYKDPFWKGNFSSELLEITKSREINLFVSSVVIKELEKNYNTIVDQESIKLQKTVDNFRHYNIFPGDLKQIDKDKSLSNFREFYERLIERGVIKILGVNNDMLPEIIDRAVWKLKPFTEAKTELKDAIIWITYARYVESNSLNDCFLLTENVSDFCNPDKIKENIFEIHSDLQKDSKRFLVYKSIKELIQREKEKLQIASKRFESWLQEQTIDDAFVMDIIDKDFKQEVESGIERRYEDSDISSIFGETHFRLGFLTFTDFHYTNIKDINVSLFNDQCLISGDLYVECSVDGYEYQPSPDSGAKKYEYIGTRYLTLRIVFSFFYDQNEKPTQFDLDLIEIDHVR